MFSLPGEIIKEPLPPLSDSEKALMEQHREDVFSLSMEIGERNMQHPEAMKKSVEWIKDRFQKAGYKPHIQEHSVETGFLFGGETKQAHNIIAELPGTERPEDIIILGAHYDSVVGSPGANDNATAMASLLSLAEYFADKPQPCTLRFAAFANEEPPFFASPQMGSYAYARRCHENEEAIKGMIALDGLGYFDTSKGSQEYPAPGIGSIFPDTANFIGLVTRLSDGSLLKKVAKAFREKATIPSYGGALPEMIPGIGWSDHWSFWQFNLPAIMITDTLPFRDPHYHSAGDRPERLNYDRHARITEGLKNVLKELTE